MESLEFCRDGILRRHDDLYNPTEKKFSPRLIPLRAWEAAVDPDVFLKQLNSSVVFEPGLTVGELFENLAPWAELMTGLACMDFPAFLAEARRGPSADREDDLSHLELSYQLMTEPVAEYERRKDGDIQEGEDDISNILRLPPRKITGRIGITQGWSYFAILNERGRAMHDGEECVSLSFCPISEWADKELRIVDSGKITDHTPMLSSADFMGHSIPLTNGDHPLVITNPLSNGEPGPNTIAIDAPRPIFYDAVIRGFLWDVGFFYSPEQRQESSDQVQERLSEVKAALEAGTDLTGSVVKIPAGAAPYFDQDDMDDPDTEEYEAEMLRILAAEKVAAEMGLPLGAIRPSDES